MKKISVDIEEIAVCMTQHDRSESEHYLDTQTGQVITLYQEVLDAIESDDEEDLPKWEQDLLPIARIILEGKDDRFLSIPETPSNEAYDEMVSFSETVKDESLHELLMIALDGRGAFRRFKDVVARYPAEQERWYKWQEDYEKRMVVEWLESEGFEIN